MIPYCNHGAEIEHAAVGLRYEPSPNKLQQVAEGGARPASLNGTYDTRMLSSYHGLSGAASHNAPREPES